MAAPHANDSSTRSAWQALGEHVLSAARYAATGRIGLRQAPGGIGTPPFSVEGHERTITIRGTDLVVRTDAHEERRPITTLAAAAELAGIVPGAPSDVYTPTTLLDPARDLGAEIDRGAAERLAAFYALTDTALRLVCERHDADDPAEIQLWPEHFDLATTINEVNLGGSPGDDDHDAPYLYVGPWVLRDGQFWDEPFGASRSLAAVPTAEAVAAFFEDGLRRAATDPPVS